MAKLLARLGVRIDEDTWLNLQSVDDFREARPFGFLIEGGEPVVWLVYVGDNADVFTRMQDLMTKGDGLPMKWAGEQLDWSERSFTYFRASIRVARAEAVLRTPGGLPMEEHATASHEYAAATRERDEARSAFEAALISDARKHVEYEEFDRRNREQIERDRKLGKIP